MQANARRLLGLVLSVAAAAARPATAGPATPELVTAAQEQRFETVRKLLDQGADVNSRRGDGATAIMWAAHWNHADTVDRLVRAGADVNARNDEGVAPLHLACENGSAPLVAKLLAAGADPDLAQNNGLTPLMIAARTGSAAVVQPLVTAGARVNVAIPSTGQTALMWAAAERHLPVVRELIAAGADVSATSTIGFTPLLFAVRNGDLDTARAIVAAGAGVNQAGADGTQALPLAIVSGREGMVMFLLEQDADPDSTMYGVSALHAAAGDVDVWLRDWLRARGASIDARATSGLSAAVRLSIVKALIAKGANPNGRVSTGTVLGLGVSGRHGAFDPHSVGTGNLKGATPLWVAAFAANGGMGRGSGPGATDIVRLLLEAGADPNAATDDGTTPLMVAAGLGRASYQPGAARGAPSPSAQETVKLLLDAGASVNAVNEAGFTALHGAAFRGLNEVVTYLVEQGAGINAPDFRGRTPYRIAEGAQQGFRIQSWPETAQLLRSLGADVTLGTDGRAQDREEARRAGESGVKR